MYPVKLPGNRRQLEQRTRRGITYVEVLMAGLLLSIGLTGLVNLWVFSFRVSVNTDDQVIAYNLGRQGIEAVKRAGFDNATESDSSHATAVYYDGNQSVVTSNSSRRRFSVLTTVVSSAVKSGTIGISGAVPADSALRTVTVTVTQIDATTGSTSVLYETKTLLAKGGI